MGKIMALSKANTSHSQSGDGQATSKRIILFVRARRINSRETDPPLGFLPALFFSILERFYSSRLFPSLYPWISYSDEQNEKAPPAQWERRTRKPSARGPVLLYH
jgi:hypothetical protein